jgi:hypothetical protein
MLAYVFWHWPQAAAAWIDYERRLLAFHRDLAQQRPPGFLGSSVVTLAGPWPWTPSVPRVYEDWYLLENSTGLDVLNDAAMAGLRAPIHDSVAALAAGGTAGLYRLRRGAPALTADAAHWFAKPAGMTYARLYDLLAPACAGPAAGLWGRQMVLGPTPEFCLLGSRDVELPAELEAHTLTRAIRWAEN